MTHYKNIFIDLDDTIWDFTANSHTSLDIMYRDLDIAAIYPQTLYRSTGFGTRWR